MEDPPRMKDNSWGDGSVLKKATVPPEDLTLTPNAHVRWLTAVSNSKRSDGPSVLLWHLHLLVQFLPPHIVIIYLMVNYS